MTLDNNANRKEGRKSAADMYNYTWDCFCEPIQNSIKSISERMSQDKDFKDGELQIHINRKDKLIRVTDNGVGFNPATIGLNKSGWKKSGAEAGYGLGLTALSLQSKNIKINSRTIGGDAYVMSGKDWYKLTIKNHPWKWDSENVARWKSGEPRTFVEISSDRQSYQQMWDLIDKFHEDASHLPNDTEKNKYVFDMLHGAIRWLSAIGHTGDLFDYKKTFKAGTPDIKYKFKLTFRNGDTKETISKKIGHPMVAKSKSAKNVYIDKSWGPNDLLLWKKIETKSISVNGAFLNNEKQDPIKARISIMGFSMATDLVGADIIIRLKDKLKSEAMFPLEFKSNERWYLSVNGYPQANVVIPRSNRGTLQSPSNSISIVDIQIKDGKCLDPGRNKLSSGFITKCDKVLRNIVNQINKIQTNIEKPGNDPFEIAEVRKDAEEKLRNNPWTHNNVKIPVERTVVSKNDEAWVQHIFSSLLSRGKIKEIKPIHIGSSHDIYDIIFNSDGPVGALEDHHKERFKIKKDKKIANKKLNDPTVYKSGSKPLPFIGEFKTSVTQLIEDIETGKSRKSAIDIHLLICWGQGDMSKFTVWNLESKEVGKGLFRCANYILRKNETNSRPIEVIVLKEYLDDLDSDWETWPESELVSY
jgi:hypothetical protein